MQLSTEAINRNSRLYHEYFGKDKAASKVWEYYLLLIIKNLEKLKEREIIYMLYDRSYRVKLKEIKKFQ